MSNRGKTTPASTGGSYAPHAGRASRVSIDAGDGTAFVFNGDTTDLDQVAPYFDDYADAVQQSAAANPDFRRHPEQMRGLIPGIAGDDEDAALRLLGKAWNDEWERRGTELAESNYDAYKAVYDEMVAAGQATANDAFRGRIPGIANETDKRPGVYGTMQDHAIYLMQQMRSRKEMQAQVDALIAEGAERIDSVTGVEPFRKIMCYGFYSGGTGVKVYEDVRLKAVNGGLGIIAKGNRNHHEYTSGTVIGIR